MWLGFTLLCFFLSLLDLVSNKLTLTTYQLRNAANQNPPPSLSPPPPPKSRVALPLAVAGVSALTFASQVTPADAASASPASLTKVRADLVALLDLDEKKRGDGTSYTGTFVRLAWHCAGTYD